MTADPASIPCDRQSSGIREHRHTSLVDSCRPSGRRPEQDWRKQALGAALESPAAVPARFINVESASQLASVAKRTAIYLDPLIGSGYTFATGLGYLCEPAALRRCRRDGNAQAIWPVLHPVPALSLSPRGSPTIIHPGTRRAGPDRGMKPVNTSAPGRWAQRSCHGPVHSISNSGPSRPVRGS